MDIRKALQEPLEENNGKSIEEKFEVIAKNLIHNFYIKCGRKNYFFAEIEFYYYDRDNFNQEWNRETYPRTDKKAGDLFFHYSGCDICFDSDFEKGKFGGILIRSLYDKTENRYITGPTVCANEILNCCSTLRLWPIIHPAEGINECEIPNPIKRYGIEDVLLCYYDKRLLNKCTNKFKKAKWDFDKKNDGKSPKLTDFTRSYNRFKQNENK